MCVCVCVCVLGGGERKCQPKEFNSGIILGSITPALDFIIQIPF